MSDAVEPIGVAQIGVGGYALELTDAIAQVPGLVLVAGFDANAEALQVFGEKTGAETLPNADAIWRRDDVQLVVVCVPNEAQLGYVLEGAKHGKHMYVQKPLAMSQADGLTMLEACRDAGVLLHVGHNQRRFPAHRKLRDMVRGGELGRVYQVEANFSHSGGRNLTPDSWRYWRERCPGLPMTQLGIHVLDMLLDMFGRPTRVAAVSAGGILPENDHVVSAVMTFPNRIGGYVGSNYLSPFVYYIRVYGEKGKLAAVNWTLSWQPDGAKTPEPVDLSGEDQRGTQEQEFHELAAAIRTGGRTETMGEEGLAVVTVLEAILTSASEGRAVDLEQQAPGRSGDA